MRFIAVLIAALFSFYWGAELIQHAPDNEIALDGLLICGVGLLLVLVALIEIGARK